MPQEDPLYAVLDVTSPAAVPMKGPIPPKLPPSRMPYYQEIDSDLVGRKNTKDKNAGVDILCPENEFRPCV